jgi:hypothetical protein
LVVEAEVRRIPATEVEQRLEEVAGVVVLVAVVEAVGVEQELVVVAVEAAPLLQEKAPLPPLALALLQ